MLSACHLGHEIAQCLNCGLAALQAFHCPALGRVLLFGVLAAVFISRFFICLLLVFPLLLKSVVLSLVVLLAFVLLLVVVRVVIVPLAFCLLGVLSCSVT